MKSKFLSAAAVAMSAVLCLGTQASVSLAAEEKLNLTEMAVETMGGVTISADKISTNNYKNVNYNNPVSSEFFCADPTAVEYEGRLYLFGTNDHQQYEVRGPEVDNTYEQIKSLVVLSTDDMVNWTYHGEINVGEVAPWITNSWAPTICSREEDDGLTHFYLYFSNNGLGTGVIHATNPLGPWDDPLGKPLVSSSTPGLENCPNPFDPGVVIDDNGVGWLSFGAGIAPNGDEYMPGSQRIVKLGDDMISFASDFAEIPAPYAFEASELNYINGTYVYTYNTDWSDHSEKWEYDCPAPSQCSMVYMTTKTPLDPTSWEMKGECFINPGTAGFDYSNNHTHMHKFKDKWYMFFHTLSLKNGMGIKGGYRSLCVDEINVNEKTVTIEKTGGTKKGVDIIESVNPFEENAAAYINNTADIEFDTTDMANPVVISDGAGAWVSVKDVEFTASENTEIPDMPVEFEETAIDTITYDITVKSVDKPTTVSMHPASGDGENHIGAVDVTGTGNYKITCDIGGADGMMNMGYFTASDDAQITFVINTMTVNNKYVFDMSTELTNTREWADGLKNIWNGFTDGDKVYSSEFANFVYDKTSDSIKFVASPVILDDANDNAPVLEKKVNFYANVKGSGRMEVRLDSPTGNVFSSIDFDTAGEFKNIYSSEVAEISGTHDLYFVFSDKNISFRGWTFAEPSGDEPTSEPTEDTTEPTDESHIVKGDVNADDVFDVADVVMMQNYLINNGKLVNPDAGDLSGDNVLNVFDVILMRRQLS